MKINTLEELYVDQLRDMHSAEKQLTKALPKLAKAASSPELRKAFESHLKVTQEHLKRIDGILTNLKKKPGGKVCEATVGLVEEGTEIIDAEAEETVRDAGLIVAAQKVEHYEIASYGCLRAHATILGRNSDARLHEKTLEEEKEADRALTELATRAVNPMANAEAAPSTK
ncbi:MAG: ferritin-like domain-containing protein [Phycisphaeraceae bacterium]|nr:ferritin-like domain-containing protein [Phycisphaeraceae bacterium]